MPLRWLIIHWLLTLWTIPFLWEIIGIFNPDTFIVKPLVLTVWIITLHHHIIILFTATTMLSTFLLLRTTSGIVMTCCFFQLSILHLNPRLYSHFLWFLWLALWYWIWWGFAKTRCWIALNLHLTPRRSVLHSLSLCKNHGSPYFLRYYSKQNDYRSASKRKDLLCNKNSNLCLGHILRIPNSKSLSVGNQCRHLQRH